MPTVLAIWMLLLVLVLGARSLGWSWGRLCEPLESVDNWLTLTPSVVVVAWVMRRCKPA